MTACAYHPDGASRSRFEKRHPLLLIRERADRAKNITDWR